MNITIPEMSMVVLIGASGSGKSSFARKHFMATQVLSSDVCRGLVSDDETDQDATNDAFDILHYIAGKRLAAGKLVVVDATNVQKEARRPLLNIAREYHVIPVAIVLDTEEAVCTQRNQLRSDRNFGQHVIRNHVRSLKASLKGLQKEGFRHVYVLRSQEDVDSATITFEPLYNNRKELSGPFDIIGDIHGCYSELCTLLNQLGYSIETREGAVKVEPPVGRRAIFLGDLVDRGPNTPDVLRLVMGMVQQGTALCVPGNHDMKLLKKLQGRDVHITHGLAETLQQLKTESRDFLTLVKLFLDSLVSHYVLDDGRLVVAHAGMRREYQGRGSRRVREFALYGETTGETDEFGLPVRYDWASEYRGKAMVVYGHTPVPNPEWLNNTINIDTGCVFGGSLSALRYPEREVVSVPSLSTYCEPSRPFLLSDKQKDSLSGQQSADRLLNIEDVTGKLLIPTRLLGNITIREDNSTAALEVMSRFAVDPRWLIYLPPTMSPPQTSHRDGLLEHPNEVFLYYRNNGIKSVICEEKHMGSRAVIVLCNSAETAKTRFGITSSEQGVCYTRTGRRFFDDRVIEAELLNHLNEAMRCSGLWEELETDWICLDCELMPWSLKGQELIKSQYAAVGAAAGSSLREAVSLLEQAGSVSKESEVLLELYQSKLEMAEQFVESYRRYCWPITALADIKLAAFHIMATAHSTHLDRDHIWHMNTLAKLSLAGGLPLIRTEWKQVDLDSEQSIEEGVLWWEQLTAGGGEGMVVKPLYFIANGERGVVQPAIKCRGREYLRIIYGAEYTVPENLERLRKRNVTGKRSLALREFALGVEALERTVGREPLRRIHECVFGVLALESEPIDPRL